MNPTLLCSSRDIYPIGERFICGKCSQWASKPSEIKHLGERQAATLTEASDEEPFSMAPYDTEGANKGLLELLSK